MRFLLRLITKGRRPAPICLQFGIRKILRRGYLGLAAAVLVTVPAWSQETLKGLANKSLEDLLNIEVTSASKKEQKLSQVPAAIFVITQEDIRRSGALNIPDLLRMVPGLDVAEINANTWAISARGFNLEFANKLLVLVDGRAVYTPLFGGVYWDTLDVPLAVEREEFRVFYQPIVRLATGQIAGVEALVRWWRNESELVAPMDFIDVAEETGLMLPISRWVQREACRQARAWHLLFHTDPPLTMTINVSPRQFAQSNLVADLRSDLDETKVDPRSVQLEITETMAMSDPNLTIRICSQLKDMGVRLSMDDFGTGHSSLSRFSSAHYGRGW
jgi:hypothetical protein